MNSRPCVRASVRDTLPGIGSLVFSDFLHDVRDP